MVHRTLVLRGVSVVLAFGMVSCGDEDTEPRTEASPERAAWATAIAEQVAIPLYEQFADDAQTLAAAVDAWAASGSAADLDAARQAWIAAMDTWQHAELTQFGPAGAMSNTAGGEDLRDLIYSWPVVNACRVDQELTRESYAAQNALAEFPLNARGLDTLEYLLFVPTTDNACLAGSGVNRDGSWEALGDETIATRRAAYASAAAAQVATDAQALVTWWSTDGEDFLSELRTAGDGSSTYRSASEALNAVTDAFFYIEKETKDMKLAIPAGLINCDEAACPEAVESPWAGRSLAHIRANTVAMQQLFHGGDPNGSDPGFDDWLTELGADALADRMAADFVAVLEALDAIDVPLEEAVLTQPERVDAAHTALRTLVTDLKTQFVTTLDLELPARAEGDND
jgi:predicted lipoprotein